MRSLRSRRAHPPGRVRVRPPRALHVKNVARPPNKGVVLCSVEQPAPMGEPRDIAHVDQRHAKCLMVFGMGKHRNFVVAVDHVTDIPVGDCAERRKSIRRALRCAERTHARRAEHPSALQGRIAFFGRRRKIVMEDAVDQEHNVIFPGRAVDVAPCRRRKIKSVFADDTILERKRRTGKDRQPMVNVHAPHLAECRALT